MKKKRDSEAFIKYRTSIANKFYENLFFIYENKCNHCLFFKCNV